MHTQGLWNSKKRPTSSDSASSTTNGVGAGSGAVGAGVGAIACEVEYLSSGTSVLVRRDARSTQVTVLGGGVGLSGGAGAGAVAVGAGGGEEIRRSLAVSRGSM